MSENEYWTRVRDLADTAHIEGRAKEEIRDELADLIVTADRHGEQWATQTLMRWASKGAEADFSRVFKDSHTVKAKTRDGRTIRKTVGYSMPVRSEEDGAIVAWQPQIWWDLPLIDLIALRARLARQAEDLAVQVEALDRLIDAMKRHPACSTAAEAWLADGHSIEEIDLAEEEAA